MKSIYQRGFSLLPSSPFFTVILPAQAEEEKKPILLVALDNVFPPKLTSIICHLPWQKIPLPSSHFGHLKVFALYVAESDSSCRQPDP